MRLRLICHPDTPPCSVNSVEVEIYMTDVCDVLLSFVVRGIDALEIPPLASPARADDLWKTTCFECFLQTHGSTGYYEFNFSPSGEWAAYQFDSYRSGMRDAPVDVDPWVGQDEDGEQGSYVCNADLDLGRTPQGRLRLNLAAVIEETNGHKSYWALAHPPGPPDFHHPDCFAAELPAPVGS